MNCNVIPSSLSKLKAIQQYYWHSSEVYNSSLTELNGKYHNSMFKWLSVDVELHVWLSLDRAALAWGMKLSLSNMKWMDELIHFFFQIAHLTNRNSKVLILTVNASCFIVAHPDDLFVCWMTCRESWKVLFIVQPAGEYPVICHNCWQAQHCCAPSKYQTVTYCWSHNTVISKADRLLGCSYFSLLFPLCAGWELWLFQRRWGCEQQLHWGG